MKYIKLVWFDVRQGLLRKPLLFAVPVVLALIACFDLAARVESMNSFQTFDTQIRAGFADFIMYIDKGGIREKGTHEELLRQKGDYYHLYMSQYDFLAG